MFFLAGGDAPELLEFATEPVDQFAVPIEVWRNGPLIAHTALGREMCRSAARGYPLDQSQQHHFAIQWWE